MHVVKHRDKVKYLFVFLAVAFLLLIVNACGAGETSGENINNDSSGSKAGTVQLYHVEGTKVVPDEDRYQLLQPDNPSAALEEIIEQLTLIKGMEIERFLMDADGNVTVYMTISSEITGDQLLLSKAALVRSVQEIKVDKIAICIQDNKEGILEMATYTDASFYYYDE